MNIHAATAAGERAGQAVAAQDRAAGQRRQPGVELVEVAAASAVQDGYGQTADKGPYINGFLEGYRAGWQAAPVE